MDKFIAWLLTAALVVVLGWIVYQACSDQSPPPGGSSGMGLFPYTYPF